MKKQQFALHRFLAVLMALYGVMSACVCNDHVSAQADMPACHHCAPDTTDVAGEQLAPHHQCCGMERDPLAIEEVTSAPSTTLGHYSVLPTRHLLSEPDVAFDAVSSLSHSPPGDIPIYLTTQRFVI